MSIKSEAYILFGGQWLPVEFESTPVQPDSEPVNYAEELRKMRNFSVMCRGYHPVEEEYQPAGPIVEGSVER